VTRGGGTDDGVTGGSCGGRVCEHDSRSRDDWTLNRWRRNCVSDGGSRGRDSLRLDLNGGVSP